MNSITSSLTGELETWLKEQNQPAFRYRQIVNWMFAGRAGSFADMTNLPQSLRDALSRDFRLWSTQVTRHTKAADGTEKLLLQFRDTSQIECVLLREGQRRTSVSALKLAVPWAACFARVVSTVSSAT